MYDLLSNLILHSSLDANGHRDVQLLDKWHLLCMIAMAEQLNPVSEQYYRGRFLMCFGTETALPLEKRPGVLAEVKKKLDDLAAIIDKNGPGATTIVGNATSLADFLITGFFLLSKLLLPPKEWEQVAGWHNGRWATYLEH